MFNLPHSTDSIKSHLCLIHLSKESFTEGELIFARAGLFDVEDSVMAKCGSAQSIGTLMGSCEMLKSVLEKVKGAISEYTMQLGRFQAEDSLYGAKNAAAKIFEWRGHILRANCRYFGGR